MKSSCRILILEDSADDAKLIELQLRNVNLDFECDFAADKESFLRHLTQSPPDLILSDYSLPGFDGMSALVMAKAILPHVPFLIVTGSVNEETAVECMKAGASDYVLKHDLVRLGPAVRVSLEQKRLAEQKAQLESVKALLAAIVESSSDAIVSKSLDGTITAWNQGAEKIFGYRADEALGRPITLLIPPHLHSEEKGILEKVRRGERVENFETVRQRKDGKRIHVSLTLSPVMDPSGHIMGASKIARDITAQKQAEESIRASLREKELLLKEVYHRVKNNLQIISSLLNLQSGLMTDPRAQEALLECTSRIQSMALLHEQLYLAKDLSQIDMGNYLRSMTAQITDSYLRTPGTISSRVDVPEGLSMSMDAAIPCGLIINELYSNCLKHAFCDGRNGSVLVQLHHERRRFVLQVSDDGVGFPAHLDFRRTTTLGLQLVCTLTRQLKGEVEMKSDNGTLFAITFPDRSGTK
jgi:PAS domain S-box-containing protein